MRTVLAATLAALLLASPAFAQGTQIPAAGPTDSDEAAKTNEEAVKRAPGAAPEVSPSGTRAATPTNTPTATSELQELLERVWVTAIDLQGAPLPGPSSLGTWQARGGACAPPPGLPCPEGGLVLRSDAR